MIDCILLDMKSLLYDGNESGYIIKGDYNHSRYRFQSYSMADAHMIRFHNKHNADITWVDEPGKGFIQVHDEMFILKDDITLSCLKKEVNKSKKKKRSGRKLPNLRTRTRESQDRIIQKE